MTDHLAEIAAMTVECPHRRGIQLTCFCRGSGRVLDPRFDGLRKMHSEFVHRIQTSIEASKRVSCPEGGCPGYTINADLGVFLKCLRGTKIAYKMIFHPDADPSCVEIGIGGHPWGYGVQDDIYQAAHEYLLQEQKVSST